MEAMATRVMNRVRERAREIQAMESEELTHAVLVPVCRFACCFYLLIFHVGLGMVWVMAFHMPFRDVFRFHNNWYVTRGRGWSPEGTDRLWAMHQGGWYVGSGIAMVHEATWFLRTGRGNGSIWVAGIFFHSYVVYALTCVYHTNMEFMSVDGEDFTILFHGGCALACAMMLFSQSYVAPLYSPFPSPSPIMVSTPPSEAGVDSRERNSPIAQRESAVRKSSKSKSPARKAKAL